MVIGYVAIVVAIVVVVFDIVAACIIVWMTPDDPRNPTRMQDTVGFLFYLAVLCSFLWVVAAS